MKTKPPMRIPRSPGSSAPGGAGTRPVTGRGFPPPILQALPRILIVQTGTTAEEVLTGHGDYDRWFSDSLSGHDVAFDVCRVDRGAIPDPSFHVGAIVTGSVKSVVEPEPWMKTLAKFLRGADGGDLPILAVCFGCQALADARGGRVVRSPAGWEIGAVEVALTPAARLDPLFEGLPSTMPVLATHEDRVETLPPGAMLLAGNDSAPVQAFRVGECVWGVQFHPEATTGILRELIVLRRERLGGRHKRLLADLERFDPRPSKGLMDNFVRYCLREREPVRAM